MMNSQHSYPFFSKESHSIFFFSSVFFGPIGAFINYNISLFTEELLKIALGSFCASALLLGSYLIARNKISGLENINQHHRTAFALGIIDLTMLLTLPFSSSLLTSMLFDLTLAPIIFNQLLGLGTLLALKLATQAIFSILERHQNKNIFSNTLNSCTTNQ